MAGGGSTEVRALLVCVEKLAERIGALEMQVAGLNGRVDGLSGRAAVREVAAKPPSAGRSTAKRSR